SLADPPEFQGLAHFCEHLLFMYLSAHGGYSNAYTDLEDTCYYFEVTYDALEGALDRFSQFFINPLFTADCTDREVHAVDSEHKKNIQNDMWRQYQIEKELSSPNHPFNLFATGNAETLTGAAKELGVDLREELLKFHAKYYSADIMKLVIVGRDSLDQLTEWAVSKFSQIESKGMTKPLFKGHPLTKNEVGKLIRIKSIREQRTLDLTFPLPDLKPYFLTKPARYLGSLVGHEGKGSVLSFLKKRGWATSIVAGRSPTAADGFDMFKVTVCLTETGMKNYKDVIRSIFAFTQLLLSKEPQKWFQDELQKVSEIDYKFMEKNDSVNLASTLASTMQNRYLPPQNILSSTMVLRGFDGELSHTVDDTRFEVYSCEVKKKLDNAKHTEPYNHIQTNVNFLNQAMMWRYSDKLNAFEMVTQERLQLFIDSLFDMARVQMIVMGNFSEDDALRTADSIVNVLGFKPLPDYARRVSRSLLHTPGEFIHHAIMPDEDNVNSGVDQSIYTGSAENHHERVLLDLLSLILQEPFFDQLRTKEQLGYITYSSDRKYHCGPMALRLLVQSESNPMYVLLRIEHFIKGFRKRLEDMTQEEFGRYVNSLKVKKEEKLKNLYEETSRFWHHVCSGYYEFDKIDHDIANLLGLTKDDILSFWDKYANPETAPKRTQLAATVWSCKIPQPSDEELAKYPAISIALHGCLHREGATELSLEEIDAFIGSLKAAADNDAAFDRLKSMYEASSKSSRSPADVEKIVAKISDRSSYVRTALDMAIDIHSEDPKPKALTNGIKSSDVADKGSLENIGAIKTPNGAWVFSEASTFKATLRQSGAPIPTRPLIPKYD
ncbi:metalloprotease, partial [Dipsacomyces acuminosporus]